MSSKSIILILLFSVLLNSNCLHNRVTMNPEGSPGSRQEIMSHYFLWGLLPYKRYNSTQFCGENGIYQVHSYTSFVDGLLYCVTSGIYAPRTLEIFCDNTQMSYRLERISGDKDDIYYKLYASQKEIPKNLSYLIIKEVGDKK